jgi:hypothetical protein
VQTVSEASIAPAPPPQQTQPVREPAAQQALLVPIVAAVAPAPAPTSATRPVTQIGATGESVFLAADGQALPSSVQERALSAFATGPAAEFAPVRAVHVSAQDLRGIELVAFEQAEPLANRFSITVRSESAAMADLQRTLRSTVFAGELDRLRSEVRDELQLDKSVTISVAGVSLGLSLVYVLWLIRGGVLMGSYLSALPAWRVLDPLPVLSRVDEEAEEDDEALEAMPDRGGDPLRGF